MALVAETSAPSDSSASDKLDEKLTEFCKFPALEPEQVDLNLGDPRSAHAINCYVQRKRRDHGGKCQRHCKRRRIK
jgi:hypothetical protein